VAEAPGLTSVGVALVFIDLGRSMLPAPAIIGRVMAAPMLRRPGHAAIELGRHGSAALAQRIMSFGVASHLSTSVAPFRSPRPAAPPARHERL